MAERTLRDLIAHVPQRGRACAPCSKMDRRLGDGGYAALQGMGGIVARVVEPGTIRRGDAVVALGWPPE